MGGERRRRGKVEKGGRTEGRRTPVHAKHERRVGGLVGAGFKGGTTGWRGEGRRAKESGSDESDVELHFEFRVILKVEGG